MEGLKTSGWNPHKSQLHQPLCLWTAPMTASFSALFYPWGEILNHPCLPSHLLLSVKNPPKITSPGPQINCHLQTLKVCARFVCLIYDSHFVSSTSLFNNKAICRLGTFCDSQLNWPSHNWSLCLGHIEADIVRQEVHAASITIKLAEDYSPCNPIFSDLHRQLNGRETWLTSIHGEWWQIVFADLNPVDKKPQRLLLCLSDNIHRVAADTALPPPGRRAQTVKMQN